MSDILQAWQERRDATPALKAEWTVNGNENIQPGAPPDPEPAPLTVKFELRDTMMRKEESRRYYDADGGPKGSMSWQTSLTTETFSPAAGFRSLGQSSVSKVIPSGETSRPPNFVAGFLTRDGLFDMWYRGQKQVETAVGSTTWTHCVDPRFGSDDPNCVTIMAVDSMSRLLLMDLDRSLGFLPIIARSGNLPPGGQPLTRYQEVTVQVNRETSTALRPVPIVWQVVEMTDGQPTSRPSVRTLTYLAVDSSDDPAHYAVAFPENAQVLNKSSTPKARSADSKENTRTIPNRPMHPGYWFAIGFGLLMLAAVSWRLRHR